MRYVCEFCSKPFDLPEPITLDDLRVHRLLSFGEKLWHLTCARTVKESDGSIKVVEPFSGQLARKDGITATR